MMDEFVKKNYPAALIQVKNLDKDILEKLAAFAYCTHMMSAMNFNLPILTPEEFGEYVYGLYLDKNNV